MVSHRLISVIIVRFTVRWQYSASGSSIGILAWSLINIGSSIVPAQVYIYISIRLIKFIGQYYISIGLILRAY